MKAAIIVFPGSNCDRDMKVALEAVGASVTMVWHAEATLPKVDVVVLPGGFSYGDYLRSGAMAAHAPILREVKAHAAQGGYVLGVCNGFQVLTEARLLDGVLMRNQGLKFICRDVTLRVENNESLFTKSFQSGQVVTIPVAHHDGNYQIDADGLKRLQENGQIALRYADAKGTLTGASNINGSVDHIAGVLSANKRVLGMMPHPERAYSALLGGSDGKLFLSALLAA
jgi:phosphoribosylformylglycinamidine synthase subunit PurQ / glutaminase